MPTAPIDEIVIGERQRQEVDEAHIQDLADSIEEYGLLQPIVLHRNDVGDLELVAGWNRVKAFQLLEREEIEYTLKEDLDPITLKLMELEENVRRKDLEWWERANAIAEIHELRSEIDPDWTTEKTAAQVGVSKGHVSKASSLAKDMEKDPSVKEEKSMLSAYKKQSTKRKLEKRKKEIETIKERGGRGTFPAKIRTGDALELIRSEEDETFDAVITNFPFGVDLELKNEGGKENKKVYEDDETLITDLVREIVPEIFRVLKDDSWFIGFFDIRKITYNSFQKEVYNALENAGVMSQDVERSMGLTWWLEQAGFSYVTTVPAIWAKPNKTQGIVGDPRKGLIVGYEAFVFAAKGDAVLLKQGKSDLFVFDTPPHNERVHPLQMPTDLCAELVGMVSLGGGKILDPFAGSGAVGLGALEKQCEFVGYELNEELASNGNLRLQEHILSEEEDDV